MPSKALKTLKKFNAKTLETQVNIEKVCCKFWQLPLNRPVLSPLKPKPSSGFKKERNHGVSKKFIENLNFHLASRLVSVKFGLAARNFVSLALSDR